MSSANNHDTSRNRLHVLPKDKRCYCTSAFFVVILISRCCFLALAYESGSTIRYPPTSGSSSSSGSAAATAATNVDRHTYSMTTSSPAQRYSTQLSRVSSPASLHVTQAKQQQTTTADPAQNSVGQPKSLKFTLIAGKYWKFNLKTNSLQTSHREKELRLHRNVSSNSFIIDDDNWFQYNHQQQQLFAWPSLSTKAATYYFVLLPSGLDFEADGEYVVGNADIVANIVVELIKPLNAASPKDLDQLIDHQFSLELLQRSSAYPLLLSQIVSILDSIAKATSGTNVTATNLQITQQHAPTAIRSHQLQGNKLIARSSNKLSEYLLIDFNASSDGEVFSLTWTTHPSLINNTLTLISECRLGAIQDIVTNLSSPSLAYQNGIDKFVIFYLLDLPLANSQALVPAERDNFSLRLVLNGSCKKQNIIEELLSLSPYADTDNREANNTFGADIGAPFSPTKSSAVSIIPASVQPSSSIYPANSGPSAIQSPSTTASERQPSSTSRAVAASTKPPTVTRVPATASVQSQARVRSPSKPDSHPPSQADRSQILTQSLVSKIAIATTTTTAPTTSGSNAASKISLTSSTTTTTQINAIEEQSRAALDAQVLVSRSPPPIGQLQGQQTKIQPQAKSLANFIDVPDVRGFNLTMEVKTSATTPSATNTEEITSTGTASIKSGIQSTSATTTLNPTTQETTLHEDLTGILNDSADYLISIAVPASIVVGCILLLSIIIALCHLRAKRKKSKQFQVGNRFKYRYGSERRGFLKNSSKPVILEADQKSLSMGGTPQHRAKKGSEKDSEKQKGTYLKMKPIKNGKSSNAGDVSSGSGFFSASNLVNSHIVNMNSEAGEGSSHGSKSGGL